MGRVRSRSLQEGRLVATSGFSLQEAGQKWPGGSGPGSFLPGSRGSRLPTRLSIPPGALCWPCLLGPRGTLHGSSGVCT